MKAIARIDSVITEIVTRDKDPLVALADRLAALEDKVNELIEGQNATQAKIEPPVNTVEQCGNVRQITIYGKR